MMKYLEDKTRNIRQNYFKLSIFGMFVIAFSLGALFWTSLLRFGYILIAVAVLLIGKLQYEACMAWHRKKKIEYNHLWLGFIGTFAIMMIFGLQLAFIRYKIIILILGVLLTLPGAADFIKNGKK